MRLCNNIDSGTKRPERAPTAVPAGLFLMGLLLMTFESAMTIVFGLFLAGWGGTVLVMRAAELACCMKLRREKQARGERVPPCTAI